MKTTENLEQLLARFTKRTTQLEEEQAKLDDSYEKWVKLDELSDKLFANTVIEDWEYTVEETEETGIGNISNDNAGTSKHHLFGE